MIEKIEGKVSTENMVNKNACNPICAQDTISERDRECVQYAIGNGSRHRGTADRTNHQDPLLDAFVRYIPPGGRAVMFGSRLLLADPLFLPAPAAVGATSDSK